MGQLDGIIKFYLENETNNAILLTGDWGVGKTYYFKNVLTKQILTLPTYFDNSKYYKPIIISLFGISSIDEIQSQILLSLYPFLGNKKVKISAAIAKIFIKGILKFKGIGDYYDIVAEIGVEKKDLINLNGLVICFDDLERIDPSFSIEVLVGFINSLTEANNTKIIIIANTSELEKDKFDKLKEKIIGSSIQFNPDLNTTYDNIIETTFSGDKTYKQFLKEEKKFFIELFEANSNNLRTLNFIFLYFKKVFYIIGISSTRNKFLQKNKTSTLKETLRFIISISIEYRTGALSNGNKQDIANSKNSLTAIALRNLRLKQSIQNNNKEQKYEKTYTEIFLEKYYSNTEYHFFESIYNFIIGEKTLNEIDFLKDLTEIYNIENDNISAQYVVFNKLNPSNIFDLNSEEYKILTNELLSYADKGLFKLGDYMTIFYYVARFNNPLKFKSLENLEKRIIRGIKKGVTNYNYIPNLDMYLKVDNNSEFYKNFIKIRETCLEMNNKIRLKHILIETENLENLYRTDFELFDNRLTDKKSQWSSTSILNHFNVNKFFDFFINTSTATKWEIIKLLQYRHSSNSFNNFNDEILFLKAVQLKLAKKIKNSPKSGLDFFVYDEFNKLLLDLIQ